MYLPHLASRLYGTPLLLARAKLDIILSVLGQRIGWAQSSTQCLTDAQNSTPTAKFTRPELAYPLGVSQDLANNAHGIAVIGITGSLVRRNIGLDAQSGLMSYAEIGQNLELAASDSSVAGILLDIDSPGGEAGGVFELAQRIREIDAIKPVWALACDSAFSAAYALACAASRVLVTQTAGVGSIGVIAMHVDQSARDAQQGYRFTAVTAGDFKGDLSAHEPLNKGASARLQLEVDRLYGMFVEHVAAMRAMTPKVVRATQAGCFFGPESIDMGLADALVRSDQVISEFAAYLAKRPLLSASRLIEHTQSTIFNANPKEISMAHDLQTNPATPSEPVPGEQPDPGDLPAPDKAVESIESATDQSATESVPQPAPSPSHPSSALAQAPQVNAVKPSADAAAVDSARSEALAIAELCQLAGRSEQVVGFLTQGLSATQVRQALLAQRTQSEEVTSFIAPDARIKSQATASTGESALMAAVKKLSGTP